MVLTTTLPLALTGVWQQQATQWCRLLLLFIASSLAGYSLSPHKEYRFVLPLVPPMCVLGGAGVSFLWVSLLLRALCTFSTHNSRRMCVGGMCVCMGFRRRPALSNGENGFDYIL